MATPVFREFSYWYQLLLGRMIAQAGLTSVADSSVLKNFCAANAQCLDELAYNLSQLQLLFDVASCYGDDLDRKVAEILPGDERRATAKAAGGYVTFGRTVTAGTTLVPKNTQVKDAAGNIFLTTDAATFPSGQATLANVAVLAKLPGAAGNVAANTLTVFGNKPTGVDSVINPAATYGGSEKESDDALKARTYRYVGALAGGTADAIENRVLNRTDPDTGDTILYAKYEDDPTTPARGTLYISDASGGNEARSTAVTGEVLTLALAGPPPGTAEGGETRLRCTSWPIDPNQPATLTRNTTTLSEGPDYFLERSTGQVVLKQGLAKGDKLTASYSYFTGIIRLAQRITNGYPDDYSIERPSKGNGTFVTVKVPTIVLVDVVFSLATKPTYLAGAVGLQVVAALQSLMQSLSIGDNLYRAAIIAAAYDTPGVENFTLVTPTADVLTGNGQLVRPGSVVLQ